MPRLASSYVEDMIRAGLRITDKLEERTYESLLYDEDLQSIVIHCFMIIGEASRQLDPAVIRAHPEIDWRRTVEFRNFIIHEYWRTRWQRVMTAGESMPEMILQWEALLAELKAVESKELT